MLDLSSELDDKPDESGNYIFGMKDLTLLGKKIKGIPASPSEARLETFKNFYPDRDYWVSFDCPEFTSLCPKTGQPDFGLVKIRYIPDKRCLEAKSLKLYLFSYRNLSIFNEVAVNRIMDDIVDACKPRRIEVSGEFNPRGGIRILINTQYEKSKKAGIKTQTN